MHSRRQENLESLLLQQRNKPSIEKRGFASPRRGIKQKRPMGDDEGQNLTGLAISPEEAASILPLEGSRSNVWISFLDFRCH